MTLKITFEACTDVGLERSDNQDHYGSFRAEKAEYFVVCDGMGGHAGGSTASQLGVRAIEDSLEAFVNAADERTVPEQIEAAIHDANDAIFSMAQQRPELRGMGTTVVLLGVDVEEQKSYIAHVGDSRIYRLRGNTFQRMTRDHTMVQRLVDEGILTEEEAENHPQSNVISRSLGGHPKVEVEHGPDVLDMQEGDIFLLCSDGLCGLVSEPDMAYTLATLPPAESAVKLVEQANDAGGPDNITAEVILFGEQAEPFDPEQLELVHPPKKPSLVGHQADTATHDEEEEPPLHEPPLSEAELGVKPTTNQGAVPNGRPDKEGAPVLEDKSSGKFYLVLSGLVTLLVVVAFILVLRTSQDSPHPMDAQSDAAQDSLPADDSDEDVYKAFGDEEEEPQLVYEVTDTPEDAPKDDSNAGDENGAEPDDNADEDEGNDDN